MMILRVCVCVYIFCWKRYRSVIPCRSARIAWLEMMVTTTMTVTTVMIVATMMATTLPKLFHSKVRRRLSCFGSTHCCLLSPNFQKHLCSARPRTNYCSTHLPNRRVPAPDLCIHFVYIVPAPVAAGVR